MKRTNKALQWRLEQMDIDTRTKVEGDIDLKEIAPEELRRLEAPLTLADFPDRASKSKFIAQNGFDSFCDVLDATKAAREARQKETR